MITTLDIVDFLYGYLSNSSLPGNLNGGAIYKHQRLIGSIKNDVVINCLPVNNEDLQKAIANVNVYVKNMPVNKGGLVDHLQPDHGRLKHLATMVVNLLQDYYNDDGWHIDVQQQNLMSDDELTEHYINIRVEFYNINESNY